MNTWGIGEWMTVFLLLLMVAYGLSRLTANWGQLVSFIGELRLGPTPMPQAPPPPPPARRRPRLPRRTPQDRHRELQWIELGLAAGLPLTFMARALRGSPAYNRQLVRKVRARMEQQAVTV